MKINRENGSILLVVMFVMVALSLTAVSYAYRASIQYRLAGQRVVQVQLRQQAASAVAIAMARLSENDNEYDHFAEPWHTHVSIASENWLDEWSEHGRESGPVFETTYQVIDEEGKLHVLAASSAALQTLGMTDEQIDSLQDWMDQDNVALPVGAESSHYLRGEDGFNAKNKPLEDLMELLALRGFSATDFMGEDANRNRLLDSNEQDGAKNWPVDDGDGELRLGWVDLLTAHGDRKININTAPLEVLATLPLSDGAAEQIVAYRAFDQSSGGSLENHIFVSAEDIDQLQGLSETDRNVLKHAVKFKSSFFRVFVTSIHYPSQSNYHLQVLIEMSEKGPTILQWQSQI